VSLVSHERKPRERNKEEESVMKTIRFMTSLVSVLAVVVCFGCATVGGGASDTEQVESVVQAWAAGLEAESIDDIVATWSEDYSDAEGANRDESRSSLERFIERGYLGYAKVSMEDAQIQIDGDTAIVYPIELSCEMGEGTIELTLAKEANGWLLTSLSVSGM
jgi:ketosteroid isomerase-like protein